LYNQTSSPRSTAIIEGKKHLLSCPTNIQTLDQQQFQREKTKNICLAQAVSERGGGGQGEVQTPREVWKKLVGSGIEHTKGETKSSK
jgi:hypothetical protein